MGAKARSGGHPAAGGGSAEVGSRWEIEREIRPLLPGPTSAAGTVPGTMDLAEAGNLRQKPARHRRKNGPLVTQRIQATTESGSSLRHEFTVSE
jgi:hypothetical protein